MVSIFSNPYYYLQPLVALLATLVLVAIVLRGASPSLSRRLLCGVLLSMGLWDLLIFGMRLSPDVQHALVWNTPLALAFPLTFVLYYHFTLVYTNNKGQRGILFASYLFLAVFAALLPTGLVVEEMRIESYGYAPVLGPLGILAIMSGVLLMGGGAYNLAKRYRVSSVTDERNRLLYLCIALLFPLTGGILDAISNLPPAAVWGNLIFSIVCSVAILRYHLLDVRVIIRKSLVYILISAVVAIPYASILLLLNQILKTRVEPWWAHALIILLLAILLRPLYSWAQQLVDRLFYRDRYDYLRALEQFSREAQSIVNLEEFGSNMVQLVRGALRTSSACLLLSSAGKDGLVVVSCAGLVSPPSRVVLRNDSPLVKWLELHRDILSSEQLNIVPQLQGLSLREKNNLEKMGANLFVPIKKRERELAGVLILGQKLSQQTYSNEDKQLLIALSSQMSVALQNARLYSDALRARENLETWLNSMSDCVMISNTDYTIQFMNKAAGKKFGTRVGEKCWNALRKDTVCSSCPIQQYLRGNRDGLHYSERIGGREYDIAAAPLLSPDGTLSVIEVLRDVTERKQAEEKEKRLQQQLYLSSRLASIGELAAGVAHEINNPLTGILGFSQRLLRKSTDKEVSQDLARIHNEALRAAKVVQNLLTFTRRPEPKKQYCDINDILQKALELRAYELKTGNIEVVTDLVRSLPKIMVDFHQIQQVFLNIIMNAEQAMTETYRGGKLSIRTQQMKGHITISFTDDGPGIPAGNLSKVFDLFFTMREKPTGTGLGLSICHGIVTSHGGKIYAKSEVGKGATFFVELPIMAEAADRNKVAKEGAIRGSHKCESS